MLELRSKGIAKEVYHLYSAYRNSKIDDNVLAGFIFLFL